MCRSFRELPEPDGSCLRGEPVGVGGLRPRVALKATAHLLISGATASAMRRLSWWELQSDCHFLKGEGFSRAERSAPDAAPKSGSASCHTQSRRRTLNALFLRDIDFFRAARRERYHAIGVFTFFFAQISAQRGKIVVDLGISDSSFADHDFRDEKLVLDTPIRPPLSRKLS